MIAWVPGPAQWTAVLSCEPLFVTCDLLFPRCYPNDTTCLALDGDEANSA